MGIENIRQLAAARTGVGTITAPEVKKKRIQPMSQKTREKKAVAKKARNGEETDLQKWFGSILKTETFVCWESGKPIKNDPVYRFGSIAHILPKKLFKSVQTHPLNYMILDKFEAHGQFDRSWEKASKMNVWPIAVDRFKQIYPAIDPKERKNIPEILLKTLKK